MSHTLQALHFPLHGSRLIEASAGTGKTWTIAALYLRLVLGHGADNAFVRPLLPQDILVMTFTRAATRELTERIRARLVQAVACFRGEEAVPTGDTFLQQLIAAYPGTDARASAAWQLAGAAQCMDEAAIYTIDAWCQRMLREHAFDSGSLRDETLESDENQRQTEAVQDYWRQHCYPLQGPALEALLGVWPNVQALATDMKSLVQETLPPQEGTAGELIERLQHTYQAQLDALAQGWEQQATQLEDWIAQQLTHNASAWDGRRLQLQRCSGWLQTLRDWARKPHAELASVLQAGATRLVPAGLWNACKDSTHITLPAQSAALAQLLTALEQLPNLRTALRLHAAACVQQRLAWLKRQAGTFGFADMLQRLHHALTGPRAPMLRARILAQYPVALIDEFQDTSPLQYQLFDSIYRTANNDSHSALLLIGDPKQSIYGFRGADIYSYLQARQATMGRHYRLGTNYRSTHALVQAVNHWFAQAEERAGPGAFRFRSSTPAAGAAGAAQTTNPLPFEAVAAQGRPERFVVQGQEVPALTIGWHAGAGEQPALLAEEQQKHLAQCCAAQIVAWLDDASAGFLDDTGQLRRLRPRDLAILVRTGKQAQTVRAQLQRRGVASVYLSDKDAVVKSAEAQDLLLWLRAVASPHDTHTVRAGLATGLMGLSLPMLAWLARDDAAFEHYSQIVRDLHSVWQRQGVLAMLRQTLQHLQLPARWLAEPGGERRITNVLHLAELLQSASTALEGEQALIRWLALQINLPSGDAQEQVLRLESDADLVKVVTVHKSKGLEYPVVFLPFAADFRALEGKSTAFVRLPQDGGQRLLRLDYSAQELAQAEEERLREDLRLYYVALTRARHAVWMGWGPLRKGSGKKCVNEHAASGYLLAGDTEYSAAAWWQHLQNFAQQAPHTALVQLPAQPPCRRWHPAPETTPLAQPPAYRATFERHWGVGSFSSLVRTTTALQQHLELQRPADDEHRAPEAPSWPLQHTTQAQATPTPWHHFARGPLVGNFLHEQLQWLCEQDFALGIDPDHPADEVATHLRKRCSYAGREQEAADIHAWLAAVLHHRLPPLHVSLHDLGQGAVRLAEMEFWLPVHQVDVAHIDALCHTHLLPHRVRPRLAASQLHGMLMGFADLVFCHQGRYWVLDYKSNHLGPDASAYTAEALADAMLKHRYDVQAALYLLALHRLLRQRLGTGYDPTAHLGGALYYFLRGLDGAAAGVHTESAPVPLLQALDALWDTAGQDGAGQ